MEEKPSGCRAGCISLIIGAGAGLLFIIIIISVVGSGLMAVVKFAENISEKVKGAFSGKEVLVIVSDEKAVSEDELESWMISRDAMVYLIEKTEEFNGREPETGDFELECLREWSVYPPTPTPAPTKAASPTAQPNPAPLPQPGQSAGGSTPAAAPATITAHSEYAYTNTTLSEDAELISAYGVDWQVAYLLCVYRYIEKNNDKSVKAQVSRDEIDDIMKALKPEIVYAFNPLSAWKDRKGKKVSKEEICAHPHRVISADVPTQMERVVGNCIHYTYWQPLFTVDRVELFFGRDIFTYRDVTVGSTVRRECTITREYDREKFLSLLKKYTGEEDIAMFLAALEQLPETDPLVAELRGAFGRQGK